MNKDEALKCLEISKTKYRAGDAAGALKFAEKGKRLFECSDIDNWIRFLKENPTPSTPKKPTKTPIKEEEEKPSRPYTPAQVAGIKKIIDSKKKGDLYGIFGLEKSCSDNDIKKAYRKMALLYHPDKCGAPNTDDAFKAIGHAWTVLGDADKRSNYDRFGIDSESSSRPSPSQHFRGHPGFQGDVSPEDLLRMFMGGGFGPGFGGFNAGPQFRTRTRQRQQQDTDTAGFAATFLQLLPVILLFLMTALSMLTTEDDPYSFQKTYQYSKEVRTSPHDVPYYVQPNQYQKRFNTERKRQNLNTQVESDYLHHLRVKCGQERETQSFYIRRASGFFSTDEAALKKAQSMKLPNCEKLNLWFK